MFARHHGPHGSPNADLEVRNLGRALRVDLGLEGWAPVLALKAAEDALLQELANQVKEHRGVVSNALRKAEEVFDHPDARNVQHLGWFAVKLLGSYWRPSADVLVPLSETLFGIFALAQEQEQYFRLRAGPDLKNNFEMALQSLRALSELFPQGRNSNCRAGISAESLLSCVGTFEEVAKLGRDFSVSIDAPRLMLKQVDESPTTLAIPDVKTDLNTGAKVLGLRFVAPEEQKSHYASTIENLGVQSNLLSASIVTRDSAKLRVLIAKLERLEEGIDEQRAALPSDAIKLLSWRVRGGDYATTLPLNKLERELLWLAASLKLSADAPPAARKYLDVEINGVGLELSRNEVSLIKRTLQQLIKEQHLSKLEAGQVMEVVRSNAPPKNSSAADIESGIPGLADGPPKPEILNRLAARLGPQVIAERTSLLEETLSGTELKPYRGYLIGCKLCLMFPGDNQDFKEYVGVLGQTLRDSIPLFNDCPSHPLRPDRDPLAFTALRINRTRLALRQDSQERNAALRRFCADYLIQSYGYADQDAQRLSELLSLKQIEEQERRVVAGLNSRQIALPAAQILGASPDMFVLGQRETDLYLDNLGGLCTLARSCEAYLARVADDAEALKTDLFGLKKLLSIAFSRTENLAPLSIDETRAGIESGRVKLDAELSRQYLVGIVGVNDELASKAAGSLNLLALKHRTRLLRDTLEDVLEPDVAFQRTDAICFSLLRLEKELGVFFLTPAKFDAYLRGLSTLIATAQREAPLFLQLHPLEDDPSCYTSAHIAQTWRELNACRLAEAASPIKGDREYDPRITIPLLRKLVLQLEEHDRFDVRQSSLIEAMRQDLPALPQEAIRSEIAYLVRREVLDLSQNKVSLKQAPRDFASLLQVLRSEKSWGRLERQQEQAVQERYMQVKYGTTELEEPGNRIEHLRGELFQAQAWVGQDRYDARAITILAGIQASLAADQSGLEVPRWHQRLMQAYPVPAGAHPQLIRSEMQLLLAKLRNYEHLIESPKGSDTLRLDPSGWEASINHLVKVVNKITREGLLSEVLGVES